MPRGTSLSSGAKELHVTENSVMAPPVTGYSHERRRRPGVTDTIDIDRLRVRDETPFGNYANRGFPMTPHYLAAINA